MFVDFLLMALASFASLPESVLVDGFSVVRRALHIVFSSRITNSGVFCLSVVFMASFASLPESVEESVDRCCSCLSCVARDKAWVYF